MNKKVKIFGIVAAAALLIVVVVVILNLNRYEEIGEGFFDDNERQIVATMNAETAGFEESEWEAPVTRVIYYLDGGNKPTNVRVFYEYDSDEAAREAFSHVSLGDFATSKKLNGRYIIFQAKSAFYKDVMVENLRDEIKTLRDAGVFL